MEHPPLEEGTAVLLPGPAVALDPPPGYGTVVDLSGVIGTVVHPPGDGTEVDPLVARSGFRVPSEGLEGVEIGGEGRL